ncbi:MAG: glycine cleavage system aminomethyltransferase GcvT [Candidatus Omnitrophota bacterium]|nr:glycine cleavage system aminomethyltransferase GcvT [Candidatus Omnitrophota bacterium]
MDCVKVSETTLVEEHKFLGARLAPFGGWLMPIQYTGIIEEHLWTRKNTGLFDICHMGEFIIEADLAKSNLEHLVTMELKSMSVSSCRYGFMLNEEGGIVDDLLVYRISDTRWMAVVNAATTNGDESHMRKYLTGTACFENVSASLGKLDLQGPLAAKALIALAGAGIEKLRYYTFGYFTVLGERIIISRTGYTGELGYELYMPNQKIVPLWRKILEDKRVLPIGLGARDTLRLEMGYSLYGQDVDAKTSPLESAGERFICWNKEFVGKSALLKQKQSGIPRKMIYFVADSRRSPRHNYRIVHKGRDLGAVTSGSFSPSLGSGIGMGYVSREVFVGEEVVLKDGAVSISAKVTDKPFYKSGSAKYATCHSRESGNPHCLDSR